MCINNSKKVLLIGWCPLSMGSRKEMSTTYLGKTIPRRDIVRLFYLKKNITYGVAFRPEGWKS